MLSTMRSRPAGGVSPGMIVGSAQGRSRAPCGPPPVHLETYTKTPSPGPDTSKQSGSSDSLASDHQSPGVQHSGREVSDVRARGRPGPFRARRGLTEWSPVRRNLNSHQAGAGGIDNHQHRSGDRAHRNQQPAPTIPADDARADGPRRRGGTESRYRGRDRSGSRGHSQRHRPIRRRPRRRGGLSFCIRQPSAACNRIGRRDVSFRCRVAVGVRRGTHARLHCW